METPLETIVLELEPIPPNNISSSKADLIPMIQTIINESGNMATTLNKEIEIEIEQTFPTDALIIVGFTFLSQIALETYKSLILPELSKKFKIRTRSKPKKK